MILKIAIVGSRDLRLNEYKEEAAKFSGACTDLARTNRVVIRSGGAEGADQIGQAAFYKAYEEGFIEKDKFEIFLPWSGFCDNAYGSEFNKFVPISQKAKELAWEIHPQGKKLQLAALKLHARNTYQILGENHDDPVDCVMCWTPYGITSGGTATAIKLAAKLMIPVFNLGLGEREFRRFMAFYQHKVLGMI